MSRTRGIASARRASPVVGLRRRVLPSITGVQQEDVHMKNWPLHKLAAWFAGAALAAGAAAGAVAQDAQTDGTPGAAAVQPANPAATGASQTKAQRKAAQKQARKEARAKRDAELKQLEDAGYSPARDDPHYPQDLQNAQKKAGIGQGASQ
jgi:hypothetical protein